jgi:hypothetical protein
MVKRFKKLVVMNCFTDKVVYVSGSIVGGSLFTYSGYKPIKHTGIVCRKLLNIKYFQIFVKDLTEESNRFQRCSLEDVLPIEFCCQNV